MPVVLVILLKITIFAKSKMMSYVIMMKLLNAQRSTLEPTIFCKYIVKFVGSNLEYVL
jgi:hypothetical protein